MDKTFKIIEKVLQYVIGLAIITGFFYLLNLLVVNPVPENNSEILNIVVGALIGSFVTVVGFYYGSSKGSADKTEILKSK